MPRSTMPLPPHLNEDPIVAPLSSSDKEAATRAFLSGLERELIIRGEDSPLAKVILKEVAEGLDFKPTGSGIPETRFTGGGGRMKVTATAEYVAQTIAERAKLASFGPDPLDLLEKRLIALGFSPTDARENAAGRVRRLDDGQVVAYDFGGTPMHPEKKSLPKRFEADGSEKENSPAELEQHRDPRRALEVATRAILALRAKDELQPTFESNFAAERYRKL